MHAWITQMKFVVKRFTFVIYFQGDGCHVAVVDGYYSYHHYMQDNFDDNVSEAMCLSHVIHISFSIYNHSKGLLRFNHENKAVCIAKQRTNHSWYYFLEMGLCISFTTNDLLVVSSPRLHG